MLALHERCDMRSCQLRRSRGDQELNTVMIQHRVAATLRALMRGDDRPHTWDSPGTVTSTSMTGSSTVGAA